MPALLRPEVADLDLAAALRALAEDGWARVGRAVADEALAGLRERADDIMLGRVDRAGLFFQHDSESGRYDELAYGEGWVGPSPRYRKIEKLEQDPRFLALLENPLFARIARAVIGGGVSLYRAVLFGKAAGGGTELPWHQDGGKFWGVDRDPTLQIWTALDDAPADSGCLEILPGTHRAGLATPLGGVVPEDKLRAWGGAPVLVPALAGEVVLIHNHVWHRSGLNRTDRPRRALTACLMDASTRCLRKKHAPRVFRRMFEA